MPGTFARLKISSLSFRGDGLGVWEGTPERRWSVPGALVGEWVEVEFVEDHRGRTKAVLREVLERAPERIPSGCEQDSYCPGCQLRALSPEHRREDRRAAWRRTLSRLTSISPECVSAVEAARLEEGYRTRATGRVFGVVGEIELGMMPLPGSAFELIQLKRCGAQSDAVRRLLSVAEGALSKANVVPFDVLSRKGLRHVVIDAPSGDLALNSRVVFLSFEPPTEAEREAAKYLNELIPSASVLHGRVRPRVAPFPAAKDFTVLMGSSELITAAEDGALRLSPSAWSSATPRHALQIKDALMTNLEGLLKAKGETQFKLILEVGCGVGTHTFGLCQYAASVIGIDSNRAAIKDALYNASLRDLSPPALRLQLGRAERSLRRLIAKGIRADVVILHGMRDPMGDRVLDAIAALGAQDVFHITPSVFALAEDARGLLARGFKTLEIRPFDTMPQTYHLMTVSHFQRSPVVA